MSENAGSNWRAFLVLALMIVGALAILVGMARCALAYNTDPKFEIGKLTGATSLVCDEAEQLAEILDANSKRGFAGGVEVFKKYATLMNKDRESTCAFMTMFFVPVEEVAAIEGVDPRNDGQKVTMHIVEMWSGDYHGFIALNAPLTKPGLPV